MDHKQFKTVIAEEIELLRKNIDALNPVINDVGQNLIMLDDVLSEIRASKVKLIYTLGRLNEIVPGCIDSNSKRIDRIIMKIEKGEFTDGKKSS